MFITAIRGEISVGMYVHEQISFEIVHCPATIWCGSAAHATNCKDEPDIDKALRKYQNLSSTPKIQIANPGWDCAISIDYWQEGAVPRGIMFAQQVLTIQQDAQYNVYQMPASLFVRLPNTAEVAQKAFGKESCEAYELFGTIKDSLIANGFSMGTNGAQEIELYNWSAGLQYAYVPVQRNT